MIRRIFPYRDSKCTPRSGKPCFSRQVGLCPGVCTGEISKEGYAARIKHLCQLFSGNFKGLKRELACEMKKAAKEFRFEEAARLRDEMRRYEKLALLQTDPM